VIDADAGNGKLLAYLRQHGHVLDQRYQDSTVELEVRVPQGELGRIQAMGARLREVS